ncbi:hypothetical protein Tco_1406556 [Tanacetum coccineum]
MTHPNPKRNKVPKAALMRSGLVSLTTAKPVNTAQPKSTVNSARLMTNVFNKAYSTVRRPINNKTTTKNSNFNQGVNTVKDKNVNNARPKAIVNIAKLKAVLNAVKGNQINAVKALACWVWKPKTKVIDHVSKHNNASTILKRFDYINAQGRSKSVIAWGTCLILLTLKKLIEDMLPLEVTPKEGKSQAENIVPKEWCDNETKFKNKKMNQFCKRKGTKACDDASKARMETSSPDAGFKPSVDNEKKVTEEPGKEGGDSNNNQEKEDNNVNSTNNVNTTSDGNNTNNVNAVSSIVNDVGI